MRIVVNLNELKENIKLLNKYLGSKKDPEFSFALNLIKRGTCFVVIEENGVHKFYPSRFIGYSKNDMDAHLNNEYKDGKETNPAISTILGGKPIPNSELDSFYREYCESLGFTANSKGAFGVERKYWEV